MVIREVDMGKVEEESYQRSLEDSAKIVETAFSALDRSDTGFVHSVCETIAEFIREKK